MSGYKLGIAIVAALVILGGVLFWFTTQKSLHIGPPTEATASLSFMRPIGLTRTPHAFMPIASGGGAGRLYVKAYRYLAENAATSAAAAKIDTCPFPEKNAVILHLAKLVEMAAGRTISHRYIVFTKTIPALAANNVVKTRLNDLATAISDLGEAYLVEKHPMHAKVVFDAVMALGYRLWIHGLLIDVRSCGLGAMSSATAGLRQVYSSGAMKNRQDHHAIDAFRRSLRTTTHKWLAKLRVVDTINPIPGDMANVVRHDQDMSWRLAAINELGVARWNVTSRSQRQAIINFLTRLEHSSNPYMRQTAQNALSLTVSDINQL